MSGTTNSLHIFAIEQGTVGLATGGDRRHIIGKNRQGVRGEAHGADRLVSFRTNTSNPVDSSRAKTEARGGLREDIEENGNRTITSPRVVATDQA